MANLTPALQLAVNQALTERETLIARQKYGAALDAKRSNAWCEYGYPAELTFDDFYRLWARQGIAHGIVEGLTEKCWETDPRVIQGAPDDNKKAETPWEKAVGKVFKDSHTWQHMRIADGRRMVGKYAGLLIQLRDGGKWTDPVTKKGAEIVRLIPAWEGQLKPTAFDENPNSEAYGEPTLWAFQEANVKTTDSIGHQRSLEVHPDRVFVLGDIREGFSLLRAGFNYFVDLEKIGGGSGESFLKNSARQLNYNFDPKVNLADIARAHGVPVSDLQELFDEQAKAINRGIDTVSLTQGATVTPLVATVPDPQPHNDVALQGACASVRLPVKVVVGMQTGERASSEDQKAFNRRAQGRRVNELSPNLDAWVRHLAKIQVIPPVAEFSVVWDDLTQPTLGEKLDNADKMATINQKNAGTGEVPFSAQEIRDTGGFENEGKPLPAPPLPEPPEDEDADPDAPPTDEGAE